MIFGIEKIIIWCSSTSMLWIELTPYGVFSIKGSIDTLTAIADYETYKFNPA